MPRPARAFRVVVVRHGPAALRDPARWPDDDLRPLTPKGTTQTRTATKGLARSLDGPVRLASSPAVRCRVTAELLDRALDPPPRIEFWPELAPGALAAPIFGRLHTSVRTRQPVVIVGHEPTLAEFIGMALTGEGTPFARLGKPSAVCLEFPAAVRPGAARLRWMLTRKQMARGA
ncbi:MAG: histidine phosphatase family protein [Thermoplasmata archaeon]|jgi:phosphohistidine phosphatase SixA|nr:histidine phosphatase family protein [Thermoplasmata archaeon]